MSEFLLPPPHAPIATSAMPTAPPAYSEYPPPPYSPNPPYGTVEQQPVPKSQNGPSFPPTAPGYPHQHAHPTNQQAAAYPTNQQAAAYPSYQNPPGYPSQQQGPYPPQQGPYPPQQGPYPPQQGPYPPSQGSYPRQQGNYPQQQGPYPPPQLRSNCVGEDRRRNRDSGIGLGVIAALLCCCIMTD